MSPCDSQNGVLYSCSVILHFFALNSRETDFCDKNYVIYDNVFSLFVIFDTNFRVLRDFWGSLRSGIRYFDKLGSFFELLLEISLQSVYTIFC